MIYLKLFWSFFQIGLFSIGGGYAALPLIENQVVDINGWISAGEFMDIVTISQMTPGAIAINAATFTGQRILGTAGAIIATIGCILPSCMILMIVSYFFYKFRKLSVINGVLGGLQPAVAALIASAGLSLLLSSLLGAGFSSFSQLDINTVDWAAFIIFLSGLILMRKFKINPILIMLGSGAVGLLLYLF
jgi:chromate transporter